MTTANVKAVRKVATASANATLAAGKHTKVDATSGAIAMALPLASGVSAGSELSVAKVDSSNNAVTISGSIDGVNGATISLIFPGHTAEFLSDGATWTIIQERTPATSISATYATLTQQLLGWGYAQAYRVVSASRDTNEAITTASVVWPDGATGTFTTDTASTSFPGAIDAYHVTHVLNGTTLTVTQAAVTRDAGGAVTAQPALVVA